MYCIAVLINSGYSVTIRCNACSCDTRNTSHYLAGIIINGRRGVVNIHFLLHGGGVFLRLCGLQNVASYISDHYAFDIPLERLAGIACMSESKLKTCFKRQMGCTVTQYIQGRRMSQAEHLLIDTDFTMGQIAQMIGYTTSSRFAELFKKSTGILPIEYRRLARK